MLMRILQAIYVTTLGSTTTTTKIPQPPMFLPILQAIQVAITSCIGTSVSIPPDTHAHAHIAGYLCDHTWQHNYNYQHPTGTHVFANTTGNPGGRLQLHCKRCQHLWTPMLMDILQAIQVTISSCIGTRNSIPQTPMLMCILQAIQVAVITCVITGTTSYGHPCSWTYCRQSR
jgi:hypothetical protein